MSAGELDVGMLCRILHTALMTSTAKCPRRRGPSIIHPGTGFRTWARCRRQHNSVSWTVKELWAHLGSCWKKSQRSFGCTFPSRSVFLSTIYRLPPLPPRADRKSMEIKKTKSEFGVREVSNWIDLAIPCRNVMVRGPGAQIMKIS